MEWWWRELKEANKPPCQPKCKKTAMKMGSFPHLMTFFLTMWNHLLSKYSASIICQISM
jgi:hypothetical protein